MQSVTNVTMCVLSIALLTSCSTLPKAGPSLPALLHDAQVVWKKGDYSKAAQLFDTISTHPDAAVPFQNESRFFAGVAYHQIGNDETTMRRFKVLVWDIAQPWSRYAEGLAFRSGRYEPWLKAIPFKGISNKPMQATPNSAPDA